VQTHGFNSVPTAPPPLDARAPEPGRLSTPTIEWPISEPRFDKLCEAWRGAGLALSIWHRDGRLIKTDASVGPLWQRLSSHGPKFCAEVESLVLAECTRQAQAKRAGGDSQAALPAPPAWSPDIAVMTAPIRLRQRFIGLVLALAPASEDGGEALHRICDRDGLDHATLAQDWRAQTQIAPRSIETLRRAFADSVTSLREIEDMRAEVQVISSNLETTYEELNLIYRVSHHMGLPQRPIDLLANVGRELAKISRSAAVAYVLPKTPADLVSEGQREADITDRIVQIGDVAPNLPDLQRLVDCVAPLRQAQVGHILLNDARRRPEFAWAAPWLSHLVALPLSTPNRDYGMQLALNCNDAGDYSSIDVQLHRAVADRVTAFLENQRLYDDLADLLLGLLHTLVSSIDAKDPYTCGHSERVAYLSRELAQAIGLTQVQCQRVYLAGLLHDVGKIGVPDAILCKPGKLTDDEFTALKKHPEIGARILQHIRQIRDLIPGVMYHHERFDGRGYPHRLSGHEIPSLGRIICLADCFDAMTTNRTYRAALPVEMAIAEIRRCAGTQFDPTMAEVFLASDVHRLYEDAHKNTDNRRLLSQIGALCVSDAEFRLTPGATYSPATRSGETANTGA